MPIQTVQSSNTFNQFRAITNLIIANVNSQLDGTANLILSSANSATINVTTLTVYGDAAIQGGDITTNSTTFTLANTTATSVRIGGAATDLMLGSTSGTSTIRSASTVLVGDLAVNGGDITTSTTTFNVANATATTLSVGGAATSLLIGAATGTATIRNATVTLDGDLNVNGGDIGTSATTFNVANTTATSVRLGGAATDLMLGATTGTATIRNASTVLVGDLAVNGGDITTSAATFTLANTTATTVELGGAATSLNLGATSGNTLIRSANTVLTGELFVNGGDIFTTATTFTVANNTATSVRIGGAATDLMLGAATGTATIRNASTVLDGDLAVNGGDITSTQTTFNIANTTATSVRLGGAATDLMLGAATGTLTIRNSSTVLVGDLNVNGGDIGTTATTFTVANTTATTFNIGGAATSVLIGATTGTATIRNATVTLDGDLNVNGGDIGTSATTFTVANTTATSVRVGGAATDLMLGATTGTTTIRNALQVTGASVTSTDGIFTANVAVNGGGITTTNTIFTLANTTATTLELGGAANVNIGSTSGNTTINSANTVVSGELFVNGGDIFTTAATFTLANTTATTLSVGGAATSVLIGATTGNTTIRSANTVLTGDLLVNGGDITSTQTTFNLLNNTSTTLNIGGAATTLSIGAATGNTTINNAGTVIAGDLFVSGGDIVGTTSSFNLANATSTTLNIGGAATSVNIGANTGTLTVRNATVTLDGDLNVNGGDIGTSATTFTVANTTATSIRLGGAATDLMLGATTGTATIRNASTVLVGDLAVNGGDITTSATTFNVANATATTLNIGGAANTINMGAANSGTFTINNNKAVINSTGALRVPVGNTIQRGTASQGEVRYNTQLSAYEGYDGANWSSLGGVKSVDGLTYIIAETSPGASDDTLHFYTANGATSFEVAQMDATKFAILQTTASTNSTTGALTVAGGVGIAGNLNVAGTQTITGNTTYTANVAVNGGGITTSANTFTVANSTATTLELGGAANVNIGSTTGNTTIRSANTIITGNTIIGGNLTVNGNTTIINSTTLSVDDKNIIIADGAADNAAANGAGITIAGSNANVVYLSASDSFDINKSIITPGDIAVNGGDITTSATSFTVANTTATSVRIGGAATDLMLGAATGTATIRNASVILDGDLAVNGGDITTSATTFTVANTTATSIRVGGAATDLMLGATTGNTTIRSANTVLTGDLFVNGGEIRSTNTIFNVANISSTSVSVGGAATSVLIGATTGTATIRNATTVITGDLTVSGGDIVGTASLNLANTTTTSLEFAGAATTLNMGAATSNTTIRGSTLNLGGVISTGFGVSTGTSSIELGGHRTGDGTAIFDFHTTSGSDFEARIIRDGGANGNFTIQQSGTGNLRFDTNGTERARFDTNGQFSTGAIAPLSQFHLYNSVAGQTTANLTDAGSRTDMLRLSSSSSVANAGGTLVFASVQSDNANSVGFAAIKGMLTNGTSNTIGGISFSTRNAVADTSLTERVRIEAGGNLTVINDIDIQGGDITTTATTFTVANTTATTLNVGGAANVNIGSTSGNTVIRSANTVLTGDLVVNGGDITSTQTTFNIANTTATSVRLGGAATDLMLGATTGNTTIRNSVKIVDNGSTLTSGRLVLVGNASGGFINQNDNSNIYIQQLGVDRIKIEYTSGNVQLNTGTGSLVVAGPSITTNATSFSIANATATSLEFAGAATALNMGAATGIATIRNATVNLLGDLNVNGGDIGTTATTFTVANTTATTLWLGAGATSNVLIGNASGNTFIRSANTIVNGNFTANGTITETANGQQWAVASQYDIGLAPNQIPLNQYLGSMAFQSSDGISVGIATVSGDLAVNGSNITTTNTTFTVANTTATSVSVAGAATSVLIGATTGNTTIRSANTVLTGELFVNGGDIFSTATTFTLANNTATTLELGGVANVNIGSTSGNTVIRSANTVLTGELYVNGGDIFSTSTTFTLANNTATTMSVGGAATSLLIGAATGTATIRNATVTLDGDLNVNGGDIGTSVTTFNVANTTATSVRLGGAATDLMLGATTGTATIRNATVTLAGSALTGPATFSVANTTSTTLGIGGAATSLLIGATTGIATIRNATVTLDGDLNVNGGDIGTSSATFTVANTTATTMSVGGAATSLLIGATTGNTTIRSANTVLTGELFVNGGDIFTTAATFTLANNTATTLSVGGAATSVLIGASTGTATIRNANVVVTGTLTSRYAPKVANTATATTLTPDVSANNQYSYTALATGLTINAPTGTPIDGERLTFRIKDNGTSRAITWNAIYRIVGTVLPTATVASKTNYVGCIYNAADTKWDVIAVAREA